MNPTTHEFILKHGVRPYWMTRYFELRSKWPLQSPENARRQARVEEIWNDWEWQFSFPDRSWHPWVRMYTLADENVMTLEDVFGEFDRPLSDRQKEHLWAKVNDKGMWGIIGEYWNEHEWVRVDSIWGFLGDDWKDSGYDYDIKRATIDAAREWYERVTIKAMG